MALFRDVDERQPERSQTAQPSGPDSAAQPPGRTRMIIVLGLLVALGPLTIDMYLPALPKIADELSLSSSFVTTCAIRSNAAPLNVH